MDSSDDNVEERMSVVTSTPLVFCYSVKGWLKIRKHEEKNYIF